MPKRLNPSSADADESKKARTTVPAVRNAGSSSSISKAVLRTECSATDAIAVGAATSGEHIIIATSSTAVAPPRQKRADSAALSSATASRRVKPSDMMSSTNGGSGGNAFLCAQREAKVAVASKLQLRSNRDERLATPKAKKDEQVIPFQDDDMEALSHNDANTQACADRGETSGNLWSVLLILLFIAANIAAAFYTVHQESMNNISLMHCSLEISTFQEEVSKSRETTGILRAAMKETQRRNEFLEQALRAQKQALDSAKSEIQSAKDGEAGGVSEGEYADWRGQMRSLESEKKKLRIEFHHRLAEFKK